VSNNATGTLQLAAAAGKGTYSLSTANAQFNEGASSLAVQITLCGEAGVAVPVNGFAFSADVLFLATSGLGFRDDGTGAGSPAVVLEGNGFSHIIAQTSGPFANSTWYTWLQPWRARRRPPSRCALRHSPLGTGRSSLTIFR